MCAGAGAGKCYVSWDASKMSHGVGITGFKSGEYVNLQLIVFGPIAVFFVRDRVTDGLLVTVVSCYLTGYCSLLLAFEGSITVH